MGLGCPQVSCSGLDVLGSGCQTVPCEVRFSGSNGVSALFSRGSASTADVSGVGHIQWTRTFKLAGAYRV